MTAPVEHNPRWVDAILDWSGIWPLARIALTSAYWIGGLTKLFDFNGAVAEQAHFGLAPAAAFAVATIVVELIGSALIITGHFVWLGAGALAVFTVAATLIAHPFWHMAGHERFLATNAFFEHLGLVAGLLMAALLAEHEQRESSRSNARPTGVNVQ
jgi:uncharacterized membrane protein YphA (DoxX/SURF4 family)